MAEESTTPMDKIISLSAKRAAQSAALEFERDIRDAESPIAAFAVYAWATVALIGSAVGGTAMMFPVNSPSLQYVEKHQQNFLTDIYDIYILYMYVCISNDYKTLS